MTASTLERALAAAIPLQPGLARLADEVRLVQRLPRPTAPTDAVCALLEAELRLAVEAADPVRAQRVADDLVRRDGRPLRVHTAICRALAQVGAACAEGRCDVARADRVAQAAAQVLHGLAGLLESAGTTADARDCPLSNREREVLRCVADGLTNAEAAACLGVAPATLKTHLDRIFDKTGAAGRAAAVATGLRRGWIV